ncbi:conjugal transfer protein TraF [Catenovulum adriaticum]|uniref:Conjugal transfer protein TraF n=1 Tax=Catenovulum adriaticum TaxID=2984846 RepID=A0ABY7APD5_9ALTE|nr:conjugal transfer protein TraF [Catenovulum sp. TS8]WAJ71433.1 conjugal transfer protein TraF [Catenovulum sp. TS8]
MKKLSFAILMSLYGVHAQAAEIRAMGMGGVSSVGGSYLSAPTNNPALLASQIDETDDFGMILPGLSIEAEDSDDLANGIDEFQDAYDRLEDALDNYQANPDPNADPKMIAKEEKEALIEAFTGLDSELLIGVDAGLVIAGHTRFGSMALFGDTQIDAKLIADIDEDHDSEVIREAKSTEELEDNLNSAAQVIAANVLELGVTYADNYEYQGHQFSVGITLKNQRVDFFNYRENISDFDEDDFDADEYLNDESNFNVDLGMVYKVDQNWTLGLSARNLMSADYSSIEVNDNIVTYKIGPEFTLGAAYQASYVTIAADVELTGTERFNGSEDDSQYASIGIEGDLFKWAQLRLGYKHDIEGNYDGKYTFGLGLAPFGVFHVDLAGQYAEDRKGALGLQLSYTF